MSLTSSFERERCADRLKAGVTGDSFTWTPEDLPSGTYAFKITDGDSKEDENYSVRFPYVGSVVASSSASSTLSTVTITSTSTKASSTAESSTVESSAASTDASSTVTSAGKLHVMILPSSQYIL